MILGIKDFVLYFTYLLFQCSYCNGTYATTFFSGRPVWFSSICCVGFGLLKKPHICKYEAFFVQIAIGDFVRLHSATFPG